LSFFYSGKICIGSTAECNFVKKATVSFDTELGINDIDTPKQLLLAVNVEGWGGAPSENGDTDRPFRWKHIMTEVTPAYKVSTITFEDTLSRTPCLVCSSTKW